METLLSIILANTVVSLIALVGGGLLISQKLLTQKALTYLVSFAAGVMLTTSFIDLLPEAAEGMQDIGPLFVATFLGIITFFFLERFVLWFHHHHGTHGSSPSSVLILLGDGAHNLIDGVAIAGAFLTSPALGIATTIAVIAHEVPHEIADFSVLINSGMKKFQALFYNFLSGTTAVLGGILGFYFLENLKGLIPLSLAFTAGMFIYIACSDLIPELHTDFSKSRSWVQTIPFILGIVILWTFITLLEGS
ncbi:MAG: ZIP family metal transporter [Candidatus Daviesbacteria bacterium]|nr:ZIP family metal transporter [Candidatus Daviesbacteria bacterium]